MDWRVAASGLVAALRIGDTYSLPLQDLVVDRLVLVHKHDIDRMSWYFIQRLQERSPSRT
eukprot:4998722-Amphidinium_carterae.1